MKNKFITQEKERLNNLVMLYNISLAPPILTEIKKLIESIYSIKIRKNLITTRKISFLARIEEVAPDKHPRLTDTINIESIEKFLELKEKYHTKPKDFYYQITLILFFHLRPAGYGSYELDTFNKHNLKGI